MIIESLTRVVNKNRGVDRQYLRNLLKEVVQLYVLNFVYTSSYAESFLFKGGTCLRFCFDLPRLSEDLDFDIKDYARFDLTSFEQKLIRYFVSQLQYKDFSLKRAGNQQQLYLKLPVMEELGLRRDTSESDILFVRIDLSPVDSAVYTEEITQKSTADFSFVIRRYALADMFASKIGAILKRTFRKGRGGKITFKGRDYYDLIWFMEQRIEPNWARLRKITDINSKKEILAEVDKKLAAVVPRYLKEDLAPFFREQKFVEDFAQNFKRLYLASKGDSF